MRPYTYTYIHVHIYMYIHITVIRNSILTLSFTLGFNLFITLDYKGFC